MAQPKNFGYDADAAALKAQAEKFFNDRLPVDQLHALVAHDSTPERDPVVDWKPEIWAEIPARNSSPKLCTKIASKIPIPTRCQKLRQILLVFWPKITCLPKIQTS